MEAARAVASAIFPRLLGLPPTTVAVGQLCNLGGAAQRDAAQCSPGWTGRRRYAQGTREHFSYTSLTRHGAFVVSALSQSRQASLDIGLANAVLSHGIIPRFACNRCSPASNHYSTPVVVRAVAPCARWSRAQRARWLDSCLAARRIDAEASAGLNYRVASTARLT